MALEYEVKLLGIDPGKIQALLSQHGAESHGTLNFRRVIFDVIPLDKDAWIRLRTDGNKTTLTYKKTHSSAIDGTEEVEVIVDDFETMRSLLEKSGLSSRNYQENTRELYEWKGCEVTIDRWPGLDPYVEIEATDVATVEQCVAEFEGLYETTSTDSTDKLYERVGVNLKSIAELKFTGV